MRLPRDEVHCWYVDLDVPPATEARCLATLTGEERSRSARFRFDHDRRRFIVAHGVLRGLLGRYLGTHAGRVRLVQNAFGKPELDPALGRRLAFNLSHSADLAAIAVAHADVGVDVERIREQPEHDEIARCCFSAAEVEELNGLPTRRRTRAFLRCWTRREAYVKARGEGLAMRWAGLEVPPTAVPAHGPPAPRPPKGIAPVTPWSLYPLRPAPVYVGALAIEGSGWRLTEREWLADGAAGVREQPSTPRLPW
jgi:4'-phosphopantetheinyl transferase